MPLMQIHQQFQNGHTELCRQKDVEGPEQLEELMVEVQADTPLPKGAKWLFCDEGSEHFVKGRAPLLILALGDDDGSSD